MLNKTSGEVDWKRVARCGEVHSLAHDQVGVERQNSSSQILQCYFAFCGQSNRFRQLSLWLKRASRTTYWRVSPSFRSRKSGNLLAWSRRNQLRRRSHWSDCPPYNGLLFRRVRENERNHPVENLVTSLSRSVSKIVKL